DPVPDGADLLKKPVEGVLEPVDDVRLDPVHDRLERVLQAPPHRLGAVHGAGNDPLPPAYLGGEEVKYALLHPVNNSPECRLDGIPDGAHSVDLRLEVVPHAAHKVHEPLEDVLLDPLPAGLELVLNRV